MKKPTPLTVDIHDRLEAIIAQGPSTQALNEALRLLAKWRAKLIENTLTQQTGTVVGNGPFSGLDYAASSTDGARIPRLLGCYERSLHPVFEEIIEAQPSLIIDVGCAEGFYAVGLAVRLPNATIWARDDNDAALEKCAEMAEKNGVAGRVKTGGPLTHADFDICRAQHTVVICDIEGAEAELMDPEKAKGLRRADILIEVHETGNDTSLLEDLAGRFEQTHSAERFNRFTSSDALPAWMEGLSDMDRLLALWEWRLTPTPWLWLKAKHR